MQDFRIGRLNGRFVVMWNEPDGRRRRYRLAANTAKEAEREARDLIVRENAAPVGITIAQIWEAYTADKAGRPVERKMKVSGKSILPAFGHLTPETVTDDDCRAYMAKRRAQGRKDGTIRTDLGALRTCLVWAEKRSLIHRAPAIEMPRTPRPRDRYLTRDEVEALIAAANDPHVKMAIILMLTTAGRSGAILDLTWDRVDLERGIIRLATNEVGPKKGRATVPVNRTARAALEAAKAAARTDYVIEWGGRRVGSIKTGFRAAVARAGIAHCTPHDLRRTAGRFMAENGVSLEEIAQYLGHSSPNVTRSVYAQFSPSYLRSAADSLEVAAPRLVQVDKRANT